jgi:hypothetical protein
VPLYVIGTHLSPHQLAFGPLGLLVLVSLFSFVLWLSFAFMPWLELSHFSVIFPSWEPPDPFQNIRGNLQNFDWSFCSTHILAHFQSLCTRSAAPAR